MIKEFTKNMFVICFVLITAVSLSACVREVPRMQKFDPYSGVLQDRGIVIITTSNINYIDLAIYNHDYIYPDYSADPTKNPSDYILTQYRIIKNYPMFNKHGYPATIYALEPGIWYINFAYYEEGSKNYYTKTPGLSAESNVIYGAFVVHPGDVLYLGEINFAWCKLSPYKMVTVSGDFERAKKELANSNYKGLVPHIQKAQFYPGGSKIRYCCDDKYNCETTITLPNDAKPDKVKDKQQLIGD